MTVLERTSCISPFDFRGVTCGILVFVAMSTSVSAKKSEEAQQGTEPIAEVVAHFKEASPPTSSLGTTSHFNFDNRRLGGNPPSTHKYWCWVHCRLSDGREKWFSSADLYKVCLDELDLRDINEEKIRVVSCRFWWKLRPNHRAHWYCTRWVHANPGNFFDYVFLEWRGWNSYEIYDDAQSPLDPKLLTTSDHDQVNVVFCHDYENIGAVRAHINGPHGSYQFTVGNGACFSVAHHDDGLRRVVSCYRIDTGELVTLLHYVPGQYCILLDGRICQPANTIEKSPSQVIEAEQTVPY